LLNARFVMDMKRLPVPTQVLFVMDMYLLDPFPSDFVFDMYVPPTNGIIIAAGMQRISMESKSYLDEVSNFSN